MPRPVTVTYRIPPTPSAVAQAAAHLFTNAVTTAASTRGLARIAISGGTTPKAMFALLAGDPFIQQIPGTSSISTGSTSAPSPPTTLTPTTA